MRRFAPPAAAALAAAALAACAPLPPGLEAVETPEARAAPFPALVPLDALLAAADAPGVDAAVAAAVEARGAQLRARAAALRAAVPAG